MKLTKGIYALRRASKILSASDLKILYSSLVLPYLNYGILVWGGSFKVHTRFNILDRGEREHNCTTSMLKIHQLQKQAIRIISKAAYLAHHLPLCFNLSLLDLPDIYNVKALSFFYDFFHGFLPPSLLSLFTMQYSRDNNFIFKKTRKN